MMSYVDWLLLILRYMYYMVEFEIIFVDLGLKVFIFEVFNDLGYEKLFLIQVECILYLLNGCDVLGMVQMGSGKIVVFFLFLLQNFDFELKVLQILVLVSICELAVQVVEVMMDFFKYMCGVNVVVLYGGQCYDV